MLLKAFLWGGACSDVLAIIPPVYIAVIFWSPACCWLCTVFTVDMDYVLSIADARGPDAVARLVSQHADATFIISLINAHAPTAATGPKSRGASLPCQKAAALPAWMSSAIARELDSSQLLAVFSSYQHHLAASPPLQCLLLALLDRGLLSSGHADRIYKCLRTEAALQEHRTQPAAAEPHFGSSSRILPSSAVAAAELHDPAAPNSQSWHSELRQPPPWQGAGNYDEDGSCSRAYGRGATAHMPPAASPSQDLSLLLPTGVTLVDGVLIVLGQVDAVQLAWSSHGIGRRPSGEIIQALADRH